MSASLDQLESWYSAFLYGEAISYMENAYYLEYTFIDDDHKEYRSSQSKIMIKKEIQSKCSERSHELRCELEDDEILDMDDAQIVVGLTSAVEKYKSEIIRDVDQIISDS